MNWLEVYKHRPLLTMDEAAGFGSPNWRAELQHRTLDDWWEPVRYQHRIGEVDVPVMHISGWYDDEEIGTPANFAAMAAAGRGGQRLLMGPWGHAVNSTRTLGEVDFGPHALIDLDGAVLAFLDEHVRGIAPERAAAPVRIFVMGAGEWRDEQAWPPPYASPTALYLSSDGRGQQPARRREAAAGGRSPATSRRTSGCTTRTGRCRSSPSASSTQIGGPDDYHGIESRGDVLVYTTDPLTEPVEVIGPVTADRARGHLGRGHRHHGQADRRAPERLRPAAVRRHAPAALPLRVRPGPAGHPR